MSDTKMPKMPKSPSELVARFDAVAADFPGTERRLTFGYPCLYVGGNMISGLFGSRWHVKLGPDERHALEAMPGAEPFEPMPGRPMTGFTLLPGSVVDDDEELRRWIGRAVDYGATLPPKVAKARSKAKPAGG
jgi:TfoX/Sxy family transcriptional regulator of competence genes